MANQIRGKYHTVKVTPTCHVGSLAAGKIVFDGTEIPNACYPGGTSLLKQIRVFDRDDLAADLDIILFSHKPTTEGLGETAANFVFGTSDATDAEFEAANPLAFINMDISEYTDTTVAGGTIIKNKADFTSSRTHYDSGNLDIFVNSNPTEAQIADGTGIPGSIFFYMVSNATKTYTANSYTFEFVFEIY